ncbi:MAG: hypothetical protein LBJ00_12630 [Planctomycetaceae bacterium]|nr:hypothetical protein [Planctomycetaceae bacterium]
MKRLSRAKLITHTGFGIFVFYRGFIVGLWVICFGDGDGVFVGDVFESCWLFVGCWSWVMGIVFFERVYILQ